MKWIAGAALAGAITASGGAQAQVFTPTYQSPIVTRDAGIYLSSGPGDLALEGIYRMGGLGLRAGFADIGEGSLLVGGEYARPLRAGSPPLALAFTASAQAVVGDVDAIGAQAGVSVGARFVETGIAFTPYLHPRIGIVDALRGDGDAEVDLLADFGVDVEFSNGITFRMGFGLDDYADWGVGLAWRR